MECQQGFHHCCIKLTFYMFLRILILRCLWLPHGIPLSLLVGRLIPKRWLIHLVSRFFPNSRMLWGLCPILILDDFGWFWSVWNKPYKRPPTKWVSLFFLFHPYVSGVEKTQKNAYLELVTLDPLTLPETNIAPENGWLEYYFPIGVPAYFQGLWLLVSGRVYSCW